MYHCPCGRMVWRMMVVATTSTYVTICSNNKIFFIIFCCVFPVNFILDPVSRALHVGIFISVLTNTNRWCVVVCVAITSLTRSTAMKIHFANASKWIDTNLNFLITENTKNVWSGCDSCKSSIKLTFLYMHLLHVQISLSSYNLVGMTRTNPP